MFLIVRVPVILGMLFRKLTANAAVKFEPIAKKISAIPVEHHYRYEGPATIATIL